MELSRLLRISRARWWLFAALAGAGLVAGFVLTSLNNSQIKPQFETIAPVAFSVEEDNERQTLLQAVVEEALQQAEEATADLAGPLAIVRVDPEDRGVIQFVGLARDEETAQQRAAELRAAYIEFARAQLRASDTEIENEETQLEERLGELADQITELENVLAVDPELVEQRDELEDELADLDNLLDGLQIELLLPPDDEPTPNNPDPRTIEDIEADISIVEGRVEVVKAQLEEIPVPTSSDLTVTARELTIAQEQYDTFLERLTELRLRDEVEEPFALGITENFDNTPQPAAPILGGLLGLIFGGLIALAIVVVIDRTRRTVWVASDLTTLPVLAELPARSPLRVAGQLWYELGGPPQRRRAVQAMRVTVESGLAGERANIGFTGLYTPAAPVQALAADFAMSMATSGNRVLLIDANFGSPAEIAEFEGNGPTLSDILAHRMDDEESFRQYVKKAITQPNEIRPGLMAVRVGEGLADPADALASRRLSIMLEEAAGLFDMTIVAAGDATDTITQTVLNRLDHVIFALRPGKTTATSAESMHAQLNSFGVGVMGAALVMKASDTEEAVGPLPEAEPPSPKRRETKNDDPTDSVVAAMERQRERAGPDTAQPNPDSRPAGRPDASEPPAATPLPVAPRVEALPAPAPVESADDLDSAVIQPINVPLPAQTPAPVPAERTNGSAPRVNGHVNGDRVPKMMESTIYHVLQGFSGAAGTQRFDSGIREVTKYGFVPLVRVKGQKTLGTRVLDSLTEGLDDEGRRELQSELVDYFSVEPGGRTNERVATAINHWTAEHYFTKHLAETGREPEIWHISSPAGTFQALTHYKRATKERIDLLRSEVLRRQLDTLNRRLKTATRNKKSNQVRKLEEQIKDVRTFDIALGWLFEGTTPNARIWYPWKSPELQPQGWDPNFDEGIRANVAPLQRLGLLVQDVLTEEELLALSPPG